ncbi:MAG: hypothetical protein ACR2ID_07555 [Chthoniobacterales bacterium]
MILRRIIRAAGLAVARRVGAQVRDTNTGELLGRALIVPWRGHIYVIGLEAPVQAQFRPQKRLTYWRQEIVFTMRPAPDFERIRPEKSSNDGR